MDEKLLKLDEGYVNPILSSNDDVKGYDPDMDHEEFKQRYAGLYQKDEGKRLSKSSMRRIWNKFVKEERIRFFEVHNTFNVQQVLAIGVDKFIYTMGWTKPSHVRRWRNNKLRVGICCHCNDQFIPLLFQANHGLCHNCRPLYSVKAIKNYVIRELESSDRYYEAHRDLLMDFYIMFYHDAQLRSLFLKTSDFAQSLEEEELEVPEWVNGGAKGDQDSIDIEFKEVPDDGERGES